MSLLGAWIPVAPGDARPVVTSLVPRLVELARRTAVPTALLGYEMPSEHRGEIARRFFGVRLEGDADAVWAPPRGLSVFEHDAFGDSSAGLFARCPVESPWHWDDEVRIEPANPEWPSRFEEVSAMVRERLGSKLALRIEHYGSTAVPGMPAKPVVDVLVEIPAEGDTREAIFSAFWLPECECWSWEHTLVIGRERPMGRRVWHLHFAPAGDPVWVGIDMRDRLRSNPEEAADYAALKHDLADKHADDREAYTEAKTQLLEAILRRASGGEGRSSK